MEKKKLSKGRGGIICYQFCLRAIQTPKDSLKNISVNISACRLSLIWSFIIHSCAFTAGSSLPPSWFLFIKLQCEGDKEHVVFCTDVAGKSCKSIKKKGGSCGIRDNWRCTCLHSDHQMSLCESGGLKLRFEGFNVRLRAFLQTPEKAPAFPHETHEAALMCYCTPQLMSFRKFNSVSFNFNL